MMANIQYGSTSNKIKPKQDLFRDLGNTGLNLLASPFEGITGKNFFNPEMTTGFGKTMQGAGDIFGNAIGAVAPAALNLVAPGAGTALSVVGKGIGSTLPGNNMVGADIGAGLGTLALDPKVAKLAQDSGVTDGVKNTLNSIKGLFRKGGYLKYRKAMKKYADGGIILPTYINMPENNEHAMGGNLTRYNGMKHEDGGIPISNTDEVEGGETSFQQGSQNPNDPGTFIFSDSILVPGTKKTFADESKKIDNRYKKRENDVWANNAKKMQLGKLAELQEQVKGTTEQQGMEMSPDGSVHKMGGKMKPSMMKANGTSRYNLSKRMVSIHKLGNPIKNNPFDLMSESPITFGDVNIDPTISKMNTITPSVKTPATLDMGLQTNKVSSIIPTDKEFNSDMTIPMAGYGLQALTNLPMLLSKPSKAKYDRITADKIDLTGQRLEAQGSRNKSLALARRNASMLGSASAVNSFTGATVSDIFGQYGDAYNKSLMNEKNTNVQIGNETKARNSQIQMNEVEANQREIDAVRSAKQQALFNIGQSAAAAGKAVGNSKEQNRMMDWLATSNPDYTITNGIISRRKNKYGGKVKGGKK